MKDIKELFEKETKLKLRKTDVDNAYYECSGVSYKNICNKVINFNKSHGTNICTTDDKIKDITTIYF